MTGRSLTLAHALTRRAFSKTNQRPLRFAFPRRESIRVPSSRGLFFCCGSWGSLGGRRRQSVGWGRSGVGRGRWRSARSPRPAPALIGSGPVDLRHGSGRKAPRPAPRLRSTFRLLHRATVDLRHGRGRKAPRPLPRLRSTFRAQL